MARQIGIFRVDRKGVLEPSIRCLSCTLHRASRSWPRRTIGIAWDCGCVSELSCAGCRHMQDIPSLQVVVERGPLGPPVRWAHQWLCSGMLLRWYKQCLSSWLLLRHQHRSFAFAWCSSEPSTVACCKVDCVVARSSIGGVGRVQGYLGHSLVFVLAS